MDDEDFDDLFAEIELLEDSSQESLTAAANLDFSDTSAIERWTSPRTTAGSPNEAQVHLKNVVARCEDKSRLEVSIEMPDEEYDSPQSPPRSDDSHNVIQKIENVFEGITDALLAEEDELVITMKSRSAEAKSAFKLSRNNVSQTPFSKERRIRFPGKNAVEAWRFSKVLCPNALSVLLTEAAVIIRILELSYEALCNGVVLSKRDIYYRDPALFGNQTTVDRYVDDIAFTFDVPRSMLNISAMAKGIMTGTLSFCRRDGSIFTAAEDKEGILVPSLNDILSVDMNAVKWILVIEKEASFRSVAASSFWTETRGDGVLITAKGYPDIATRALLHFMSTPSPRNGLASPPVYGLVDFDPDGLAIFSVYKHGSVALSHENAELCVPQMQWLGLRDDHLKMEANDVHADQGLLSLTTRDRRKGLKMLERIGSREVDRADFEIRSALQTMLVLNMKAELQLLDACPNGMSDLLRSTLSAV